MENVYIMNHPLIQHKISMLRNKNTGTNEFRKLVEEIGILMGYEALRDLPVENVEVETPIETCMTPMISGKKLAVIPVLRAGLGMVNSILTLVPSAKVGHVGLYRDPVTHEPHEYYCKLPEAIDERISVIVDPMLATGGSAEAAVDFVKKQLFVILLSFLFLSHFHPLLFPPHLQCSHNLCSGRDFLPYVSESHLLIISLHVPVKQWQT